MQSGRPGPPQPRQSNDPLATDTAQALERARRQLQSLMRMARGEKPDPSAQQRLLRDALRNMQTGMSPAGRGAPPTDVVSTAQRLLEDEKLPLDLDLLRRLIAQLDRMQIERLAEPESAENPKVTHLEPQNYPPGYRDWIQRYYRRLAEQP